MRASIIIPVYHEYRLLPAVLERMNQARLSEGCEKEVTIMDDASTDGSSEPLDFYESAGIAVVHRSSYNFGKGNDPRKPGASDRRPDSDPGRRPGVRSW
jgi:glycosyltransferase involved in cell wall biosynthesis